MAHIDEWNVGYGDETRTKRLRKLVASGIAIDVVYSAPVKSVKTIAPRQIDLSRERPIIPASHQASIRIPRFHSPSSPTIEGAVDAFGYAISQGAGHSIAERKASLEEPMYQATIIAMLSIYGSRGISLRKLIVFATLRLLKPSSTDYWMLSGERDPIYHNPESRSYSNDFPLF